MKRFALRMILTLLSVVGALNLHAYDFEVDGIYYNILSTTDLTVAVAPKDLGQYYDGSSYYEYGIPWEEHGDRNTIAYKGEVNIPEQVEYQGKTYTVTSIAQMAFITCSELTKITIPKTVTLISTYKNFYYNAQSCFAGCTNLDEIVVAEGNPVYDSRNNCNALIETATNKLVLCTASSIIIPETVTSIGSGAFTDNTRLTSLTIPSSVTSIGTDAFYKCSNLKTLRIQDSNATLNISSCLIQKSTCESMFDRCPITQLYIGRPISHDLKTDLGYNYSYSLFNSRLNSVEIGKFVSDIGSTYKYFFTNSTNISRIDCKNQIPPNAISCPAAVYTNATLNIPKGSLALYKSHADWGQFVNIVETFDYSGVDDVAEDVPAEVDVYNMQGVRVRKGVQRSEATQGLPQGIYIIGGEKVLVK